MQYYKPLQPNHFVGDCMPFYHNGLFHLFYLLDENHHSVLDGLGGHQWAHASSSDLNHWTHHPLALPITEDWEGSICTGSVFFHHELFYAFYATRKRDRTQHLSLATSRDGINFIKTQPNPFFPHPAGYHPEHFRDPFVFHDHTSGLFHMLVTSWLTEEPVPNRGGCLAHLVSKDLQHWQITEPFLVPGLTDAPECPDYFFWNGWYYLLFSSQLTARYRMSRQPFGPWMRPPVDTFEGSAARVMKTAPFGDSRRLGVAWLGTRANDRDDQPFQWGGQAVFRELVQHPDGSLSTRFVREMIPKSEDALDLLVAFQTAGVANDRGKIKLNDSEGLETAAISGLTGNYRVTACVNVSKRSGDWGLRLRSGESFDSGYELRLIPALKLARLGGESTYLGESVGDTVYLDIVLKDSIIDVCLNHQRCLINRAYDQSGDWLWLFALNCDVSFDFLEIQRLD